MAEVQWDVVLACVIVVAAAAGLIKGSLTAKDFITIIGMVLSFLAGKKVGYNLAMRKIRGSEA